MTESQSFRLRRPSKHKILMKSISDELNFSLRDILLIAAGIGYKYDRSEVFEESDERIRLEIFEQVTHAREFISMLSTSSSGLEMNLNTGEIEILLQNQFKIFEEFACGGLSWIQEQATSKDVRAAAILVEEVEASLLDSSPNSEEEISDLLGIDAF